VSLATTEEGARASALVVNYSMLRSFMVLPLSVCNIVTHIDIRMHSMLENQDNVHGVAMQLEISLDTSCLFITRTSHRGSSVEMKMGVTDF
jgi:hypothetical protein